VPCCTSSGKYHQVLTEGRQTGSDRAGADRVWVPHATSHVPPSIRKIIRKSTQISRESSVCATFLPLLTLTFFKATKTTTDEDKRAGRF